MYDVVERLGKSIVQHGKLNDRVYLMKLAKKDFPFIIDELDNLAVSEGYSKIFVKVPAFAKNAFEENSYIVEAHIPGFFNGNEDAYFMGKYLSSQRQLIYNEEQYDEVVLLAKFKSADRPAIDLPYGYRYGMPGKQDVEQMAEVYRRVFQTYPFPVHDPKYLSHTMDENVVYFGVYKDEKLVALSSAEMDVESRNVEMTDFATLPEHRGKGLAVYLLGKMEEEVSKRGIKVAYTIARATSQGINITFAKMGYQYCGTLINNTNISGSFESMNVWWKFLQ